MSAAVAQIPEDGYGPAAGVLAFLRAVRRVYARRQRRKAVAALAQGQGMTEVARRLGLSYSTVRDLRMRLPRFSGVVGRKARERALRAAELRRLGHTYRQIGELLGVTRQRAAMLADVGERVAARRAAAGVL